MQKNRTKKIYVPYLLFIHLFAILFLFGMSETAFAAKKDISACNVILSQTSFIYSGNKCGPEVTVKDGGTVLQEGTDYALYGNTASTIGTHEITIVGMGDYTGQTTASFQITKAKNVITLFSPNVYYTFSEPRTSNVICCVEEGAKLSFSTNTKGASITSDGMLSVKDGFLGTVIVHVTSSETEHYQAASASFSIEFKLDGTNIREILDQDVTGLASDDHTVYVRWSVILMQIGSVDGFQIRHSKDPNFQSNVHTVKIPMLIALGMVVSGCEINKNLVKGDRVYFQIRTYKTALDGKTYYSEWSESVMHDIDSSPEAYYRGKAPKNGKVYKENGIRYRYKNGELAVAKKQNFYSYTSAITIPNKVDIYGKKYPVTSIEKGAFRGLRINKIVIGKNVKKIGANAFANINGVEKITIKSKKLTAKSIGKNAFKNFNHYTSTFFGRPYVYNMPVKLVTPKSVRAKYIKLLKKSGMIYGIK